MQLIRNADGHGPIPARFGIKAPGAAANDQVGLGFAGGDILFVQQRACLWRAREFIHQNKIRRRGDGRCPSLAQIERGFGHDNPDFGMTSVPMGKSHVG